MINQLHFAAGVFVGVAIIDALVVKHEKSKNHNLVKANKRLAGLIVESEKRVVYLSTIIAKNDLDLDAFDMIALTTPTQEKPVA